MSSLFSNVHFSPWMIVVIIAIVIGYFVVTGLGKRRLK